MFHTSTSKVSLHCTRLSHSLSAPSPCAPSLRFLKGFCWRFTFSSSHSYSQLFAFFFFFFFKSDFIHCFIGVYYDSITLLLSFSASCSCSYSVCPFLPILPLSLPSSSRPSPSAERWMDGTKWLMNQWTILCVWQKEREIEGKVHVCILHMCVCLLCVCVSWACDSWVVNDHVCHLALYRLSRSQTYSILQLYVCMCCCMPVHKSPWQCVCVCVCVHRYACAKQDTSFSKRGNGFLWTEHYLNGNNVKSFKKKL